MTKLITYNFTNPSGIQPIPGSVTIDHQKIDTSIAQKSMEQMSVIIQKLFARMKEQNREHYDLIIKSRSFTVSIKLPSPGETYTLNIVDSENKWTKSVPLTQSTAAPLDLTLRSLVHIQPPPPAVPKTVTTPAPKPTPAPLPQTFTVPPVKPSPAPLPQTFTAPPPKPTPAPQTYKKAEPQKKAETAPAPSQGWFSRLTSWMTTSSKKTEKSSSLKSSKVSTPLELPPPRVVEGIRPLQNGNNICFINALFQALMNIPEMKQTLIEAHGNKVEREQERLQQLKLEIFEARKQLPKTQNLLSNLLKEQKRLQDSMRASLTLIEAVVLYNEKATYLNNLRGFIPGSISQQEDACELLDRIFEPLFDLLEHPDETTTEMQASLKQFLFHFGERKYLEPYIAKNDLAKAVIKFQLAHRETSPLPKDGLHDELAKSALIRVDMPSSKTQLSELLKSQLAMHKPLQKDDLSFYEHEGQKSGYQVTEKQLAISSIDSAAPTFVALQLKRFRANKDGTVTKIGTEIELPPDNIVTLVVDGKEVRYELQSLVLHTGTLSGGHYFSYIRKNGAWYVANDAAPVQKLDKLPSTTQNQVYTIFLKKV